MQVLQLLLLLSVHWEITRKCFVVSAGTTTYVGIIGFWSRECKIVQRLLLLSWSGRVSAGSTTSAFVVSALENYTKVHIWVVLLSVHWKLHKSEYLSGDLLLPQGICCSAALLHPEILSPPVTNLVFSILALRGRPLKIKFAQIQLLGSFWHLKLCPNLSSDNQHNNQKQGKQIRKQMSSNCLQNRRYLKFGVLEMSNDSNQITLLNFG